MCGDIRFDAATNVFAYRFRRDSMLHIECLLNLPPAGRFIDGTLHGLSHCIRIKNDFRIDIASGPPDGLNQ